MSAVLAWVANPGVLGFIKGFFVVMFSMNLGALLTWADRRQGSMIQDRVGPQRAGVWVPRDVVRGLVSVPAFGAAAGVLYLAFGARPEVPAVFTGRAMLFAHLAIFVWWFTLLLIGGRIRRRGVKNPFDAWLEQVGDPRRIFWIGIGVHAAVTFVGVLLRGTEPGRFLRDLAYGGGAGLLAFGIVGGAVYAALRFRHERVRVTLFGILHPAADGLKFIFKEDFIPPNADRLLHGLAPIISVVPALVVLAVVPFGDTLCFGTDATGALQLGELMSRVPREGVCTDGALSLQAVDLNVGVLFFFAVAGTGIVGAALAGWSSDNKYSLIGGLRGASQMVSYEVTLGLTIVGVVMVYGTLRVDEMIRWQAENSWGVFVQPLAFCLFLAAAIAEQKRIPFDLPEGESELVAGYFTEYSSMKFAMFMFSEYVAVVTSSGLMAALFFGGWSMPFLERDGLYIALGDTVLLQQSLTHGFVVLLGFLAFIVKVIVLCWLQLTIRWSLPRFRYDQLMHLGWRKLLPASLINILVTGLVVLALQGGSAKVLEALRVLGQVSDLVVGLVLLGGVVALVGLFLSPVAYQRLTATSAAKFAVLRGGTKTARMGV